MTNSILSILALLVLAQLSSFANAAATIPVENWVVPYKGVKNLEAKVGDTIVFEWVGGHNVYIHPSMSCDLEGAINVGSSSGSSYTFVEADGSAEGTDMFFSCDINNGGHCMAGQSLTVKVLSGDSVEEAGALGIVEADPPKADPPKADPPKADPPKADPPKADPAMADAAESNEDSSGYRAKSVAPLVGLASVCLAIVFV